MNDIQPVETNSKYWKKGDVFLSMPHLALVVLYRPNENKVIWYKQGPWLHQHDVDIINETTIGIYNNNDFSLLENETGFNNVLYYNFETQKITNPYKRLFENNKIKSKTESLFSILDNGDIFVEENNHARILRGDKEGNLKWHLLWDARINWARFLSEKKYKNLINEMNQNVCK